MDAPTDLVQSFAESGAPAPRLRAAWLVSLQSLLWTVIASSLAIAVGITRSTVALVAFGAIGFVDAIGSAALVLHFRHAIRHERISSKSEHATHVVVAAGLVAVGVGTVVVDAVRISESHRSEASIIGTVLTAMSLLVLGALAIRKCLIARQINSRALRTDGHVSAVGAALAAVALGGSLATQWLQWTRADAVAAMALGFAAVVLGLTSAVPLVSRRPDRSAAR